MFGFGFYYCLPGTPFHFHSKNFSGSKLHKSLSLQTRQCAAFDPLQSARGLQPRKDFSVCCWKRKEENLITSILKISICSSWQIPSLYCLSFHFICWCSGEQQYFTFVNFHVAVGPIRTRHHFAVILQQERILVGSSETEPALQCASKTSTQPQEKHRKHEIFQQHLLSVQSFLQLKFPSRSMTDFIEPSNQNSTNSSQQSRLRQNKPVDMRAARFVNSFKINYPASLCSPSVELCEVQWCVQLFSIIANNNIRARVGSISASGCWISRLTLNSRFLN